MLDLGCGPALFLCDLGTRYPAAALYGYDVTQAMVAHGQALACTGAKPIVTVLDPLEAHTSEDGSRQSPTESKRYERRVPRVTNGIELNRQQVLNPTDSKWQSARNARVRLRVAACAQDYVV